MSYLYLFYSDYVGGDGTENGNLNNDPYSIIAATKESIKMKAIKSFQSAYISSAEIEQAFEKKYNINPNDFGAIDIFDNEKLAESNAMMMGFDSAISELKKLIKEGGTIAKAQSLGQEAIYTIDTLLNQGAQLGGLAEGAYNQLQQGMEKMRQAHSLTKYKGSRKEWVNKDEILKLLKDIESNVSGYAFELAVVYGFVGAAEHGLKENHKIMVNIGSNTIGNGVYKTFKEDPQMLEDLKEISSALSENTGQPKADSVVSLHMSDGQGNVVGEATWVGFQQKNYRDISRIPISVEKTLEELNFFSYYNETMAINVAGSLGSNYRNGTLKIDWSKRRSNKNGPNTTQGEIDKIWNGMINSMKLLMAADAIAGKINDNFTNKINYWIIRDKSTAQIRVIGVSKILDKIATAFMTGESSVLGLTWDQEKSGRYTHREKYWSTSIANFDPSKQQPEAKMNRSNRSWNTIRDTILSTKISISLNFSSFF